MKGHHKELIACFLVIIVGLINSCGQRTSIPKDLLKQNLKLAGKNRAELEKVLSHFSKNPRDSLKYQAAVFLISNMEYNYHYGGKWPARFDTLFFDRVSALDNNGIQKLRDSIETEIGKPGNKNIEILPDLNHLSSTYIINNIEEAYTSWQEAPWSATISFDAFCNYILPYKSSMERTEDWRRALKERYNHLMLDPDLPKTMMDVSCAIIDEQRSWFHWTGRLGYFPGVLSISQILRAKKGSCNEMANLGAYSARALGIPVAIDYTPQYGNDNDAHRWNALILSDSTSEHFEGGEARPGDIELTGELEQKFAKIFRQQSGWVHSSFAAKAFSLRLTDIPEYLADPRIKDVTALYTSVSDVRLSIKGKQGTPVYLCVFKRRNWVAIEGGFIQDQSVTFKAMGRGLVYLPMYYSRGSYEAAGYPVLVKLNGKIDELKWIDTSHQHLHLYRKYPFKRRWAHNMIKDMTGARFEGDHNPGFQNSVLVHRLQSPMVQYRPQLINHLEYKDRAGYDFCWTEVNLNPPVKFQYLRMVVDRSQPFRVGEIEFYTKDSRQPLTGVPFGNVPEPHYAFDGFPGESIKLRRDTTKMVWAGINLGERKVVDRIRYIPDPDRNAVTAGKTYALYYWDNKWISAGMKKGSGHLLEYKDMPSGGLYWLNCIDCDSSEERIFTYENGKQVWW